VIKTRNNITTVQLTKKEVEDIVEKVIRANLGIAGKVSGDWYIGVNEEGEPALPSSDPVFTLVFTEEIK
jgi:hypothetical protein